MTCYQCETAVFLESLERVFRYDPTCERISLRHCESRCLQAKRMISRAANHSNFLINISNAVFDPGIVLRFEVEGLSGVFQTFRCPFQDRFPFNTTRAEAEATIPH
jgi:hypothetical protein